jgi:hypothetical protein
MGKTNYFKLSSMLFFSFIIMYSVMFFNVDKVDNVYLNLNRLYMTILMVAPMAIIMLLMMSSMFRNELINKVIIIASLIAITASFILLRTQTFVGDIEFMKSMIPHHSSAILVSEQANIKDPEVKKLAWQIIESQKEEISQMKILLERLDKD